MKAGDVDFLIIGAAKSATTWLQTALQADPAVAMPDPELHYFSRVHARGDDWYFAQFPDGAEDKLAGEKSNSYLDDPQAAPRIHALLPHARLVVQLRNPVERAYSDYCMLYRRGEVGRDIAAHLDARRAADARFLMGGLYHDQLQPYLERFPADRMLILFYEDMLADPAAHLKRVRGFLGLPETGPAPALGRRVKDRREAMIGPGLRRVLKPFKPLARPLRGNKLFEAARRRLAGEIDYPALTPDLRRRLVDFYGPDAEKLGTLTRRDLGAWLTARPPRTSFE